MELFTIDLNCMSNMSFFNVNDLLSTNFLVKIF